MLLKRSPFLVVILATAACGPESAKQPSGDEAERYADAFCSATDKCGCQPRHGGASECRDEMEARFSQALDADFTLDVECFEDVVERGGLDDCEPVTTWSFDEWYCPVLRGNKKHHEECDPVLPSLPPFDMDECEKGLRCIDAMCVQYDEVGRLKSEGESCSPKEALSCNGNMLYCSPAGVCEQAPLEGESCTSNDACLAAHVTFPIFCAGIGSADSGICTVPGAEGASCDPRDTVACLGDEAPGWCDPSTNTCRTKGPAICGADDYQAGLMGAAR